MRLVKLVGLATVVATMATALLGAPTATATEFTTLCKEDTAVLTCPDSQRATGLHFVSPKANTIFLNSMMNVSCEILFGAATPEGPLGKPLFLVGHFTFANCTAPCTVKEIGGPAVVGLLKTGAELASVAPEVDININCLPTFNCNYDTETTLGHALGGLKTEASELLHLTFKEAPVKWTAGGVCPKDMKLDALFKSLEKLYIRT